MFPESVDTPYCGGCFEFDVFIPSDYPASSPKCKLVTTGECICSVVCVCVAFGLCHVFSHSFLMLAWQNNQHDKIIWQSDMLVKIASLDIIQLVVGCVSKSAFEISQFLIACLIMWYKCFPLPRLWHGAIQSEPLQLWQGNIPIISLMYW